MDIVFIVISIMLQVDSDLLNSICWVESNHRPHVINYNDGSEGRHSYGLCQIQMRTAKYMGFEGQESDLMNKYVNAFFSGKYILYLSKKYDTIEDVVSAYNAGSVRKLPDGRYINQSYVNKVLEHYENRRSD